MRPATAAVGAVLAGGAARRMGGAKMTAPYRGRPLIVWPLAALRAALDDVVVVAKRNTPLPPLEVPVWLEPDEPRHPLTGIVHALRVAGGRDVLVCAGDMPAVEPDVLRALLEAPVSPAVVPRAAGRLQPLLARYSGPAARELAAAPPDVPLTDTVAALQPLVLDFPDPAPFRNVNTPEDLGRAP